MKKITCIALPLFCLLGCKATAPPQRTLIVDLKSTFDSQNTIQAATPDGDNTIQGNGFLRQRGGGVVTCAGSEVSLIPVTEYSTERFNYVFGNGETGFKSIVSNRPFEFNPNYPAYHEQGRQKAYCDASGEFVFANARDGQYYLQTVITWETGSAVSGLQGGAVMKKVQVSGGETSRVILTP